MAVKNFLKFFGIAFLIIGFVLIINSFYGITGWIVAENISKTGSLVLGLGFILLGITLIYSRRSLEERVRETGSFPQTLSMQEFENKFSQTEPDAKKRSIVLDTSAILTYKPGEVEKMFKDYEKIYIPKSVYNELKGDMHRLVDKYKGRKVEIIETNNKNIRILRKIARNYLMQGTKPRMYDRLSPYFSRFLAGQANKMSRQEKTGAQEYINRLLKVAREDSFALRARNPMEFARECRNYLEKHCKLSDTDVDVLATALYAATKEKKHALLGGNDLDLKEAVSLIRRMKPDYKNRLDYVDPYRN